MTYTQIASRDIYGTSGKPVIHSGQHVRIRASVDEGFVLAQRAIGGTEIKCPADWFHVPTTWKAKTK